MTTQDIVLYGLFALFVGAMFIPAISSKLKKKN